MSIRAYCLVLAAALLPLAANAATSVPVRQQPRASILPEPGNLVLFAAGIAGLIIGRRGSRSGRRDD